MAIDNDALLAAIDEGRENSYGSDEQSELGRRRAKALEYYLGLNTNPAPEGRSQVVDRSVYETISTMLPSLVRIFASSSDEIVKCIPVGPEDEQGAEQQTAVLNHVVTQQNQWHQIVADWIHDALLMPNAYAMAYWDESKNMVREVYEGQSEDQVAALLQDTNVTVLQHSQTIDQQATAEAQQAYQQALQQYQQQTMQYQQAAQQTPPDQLPPPPMPPEPPQPVTLHDLVIERVENEGKVCIRVLPPEHCYVSQHTPNWTLQDCPYFEFKDERTIAELRSMGLDVPDDVSDHEDDDNEEDDVRDRFGEDRELDNAGGVMRRVWARMIWVRADAEGDGQSRLYYVIAVGRTILFAQPVANISAASITSQPLPHRHPGMAVAETVFDIQDVRTFIKRGGLDNLALANSGRHAVSDKVNLEDFLDSRPGSVVRMIDGSLPAEGHIMPIVHPVAFQEIVGTLEYFDIERQNRTGAIRGSGGVEADAINRAAVGTTIANQNAQAQQLEHIARMIAPGVEALFQATREIIAKHQNKALTLKLKGEWVTVDPQAWRTKRDIRISVGVGAGNKESMIQNLRMQLMDQANLMPMGLAQPQNLYETALEISKLNGYANPAKYWNDPRQNPPGPPPPSPDEIKAQTTMQVEQMRIQADAQKFQAEMQAKAMEIQAQTEAKMRELQASMEVQASNDQRDSIKEQQRAEMQAQIESLKLANEREIAAMNAEIAKYKADLDAQVKLTIAGQQNETAKAPAQELGGIKQMVEKLAGSQTVAAVKIKGPDGRLAGVRITQADGSTRDVPVQ